jgi:hypothetical protein
VFAHVLGARGSHRLSAANSANGGAAVEAAAPAKEAAKKAAPAKKAAKVKKAPAKVKKVEVKKAVAAGGAGFASTVASPTAVIAQQQAVADALL